MVTYISTLPYAILDGMIEASISKDGYALISIPPTGDIPQVTYSLGLYHSLGHPDLVILGFSPEVSHEILRDTIDSIKSGNSLDVDMRYTEDEGPEFEFETYALPDNWRLPVFGRNLKYLNGEDVPVLVLMFPDQHGHYFGSRGYDPHYCLHQVDLRTVDPPHVRVTGDTMWVQLEPSQSQSQADPFGFDPFSDAT
jgi:hypothetical protein